MIESSVAVSPAGPPSALVTAPPTSAPPIAEPSVSAPSLVAVSPGPPAPAPPPAPSTGDVSISVDVVCPDRLARQGFAFAPFPIRVPSDSLLSLASVFAALKPGALVDATESFEFLQSVGAQEWVLPQNGVIFAQERPLGPSGRQRWTALKSVMELVSSEPLLVCGVREWRKIKAVEAKDERADILHKRKLEESRTFPPDRGSYINGRIASVRRKAVKLAPGSRLSPTTLSPEVLSSGGGTSSAHDLPPTTPSPNRTIAPASLVGPTGHSLSTIGHQDSTQVSLAMGLMASDGGSAPGVPSPLPVVSSPGLGLGLLSAMASAGAGGMVLRQDGVGEVGSGAAVEPGGTAPVVATTALTADGGGDGVGEGGGLAATGGAAAMAGGLAMGSGVGGGVGVGGGEGVGGSGGAAGGGGLEGELGSPVPGTGGVDGSGGGLVEQQQQHQQQRQQQQPQQQRKTLEVSRRRMHKVHGPAFCKMFQMLKIRFIPQGSATTLRDNSHIVMGYAAKGEEFGRLPNKAATVKMKNIQWTEPGFMGLLAAAGGGSLATLKLPERAERVFSRMMSSESMRVSLMWHCAEACTRLCTYGSVYKDKKGRPFDSLASAFIDEFRIPSKTFPESVTAALAGVFPRDHRRGGVIPHSHILVAKRNSTSSPKVLRVPGLHALTPLPPPPLPPTAPAEDATDPTDPGIV